MATTAIETLQQNEAEFYRETFRAMDVNQDGVVDMEEFYEGLQARGVSRRRVSVVRIFNTADTNNDGVLDEDEFVELLKTDEMQEYFATEQAEVDKAQKRRSVAMMTSGLFKEIYGQKPAMPETTEIVKEGIVGMKAELEEIADSKKSAFKKASSKCPELLTDEFMLMFLRCDLFDTKSAAKRFINYWEQRERVFGKEKAFQALTLKNFDEEDKTELSLGHERVTGVKDPEGRPIVYVDFTVENKTKYKTMGLVRAWWYLLHAVLEDEDAQRHGVVFFINNKIKRLLDADLRVTYEMCKSVVGAIPLRLSACHMIRPHAQVGWIVKIARLYLGPRLRKRIHVNKQSDDEKLLDDLAGYGINPDMVPSIWGGNLELPDHQKWLEDRREQGL